MARAACYLSTFRLNRPTQQPGAAVSILATALAIATAWAALVTWAAIIRHLTKGQP